MIKIVVVDDCTAQLELLLEILSRDNRLEISSTAVSKEAFDLILEVDPHIVILDVLMPSPDGIELREMMSENELTKHIPVIFISASKEDKSRGMAVGCYDYLHKPFQPEELLNSIKDCRIHQLLGDIKKNILDMRIN